jgi:RimJ/RimL family protein N-acetyltransferase
VTLPQTSLDRVEGPNLVLRLIQPADAGYVYGLRINPAYNSHLSEIRGTADDQRRWIDDYKAREADGSELYYIIERRDGMRCGTVRLYDIQVESFTWGSWILDQNKPPKAALESAMLSFGIGFQDLGLERATVDVRIANTHAEAFYRRLGMTETHRTEQDIFFVYPRSRFEAVRAGYQAILEKDAMA